MKKNNFKDSIKNMLLFFIMAVGFLALYSTVWFLIGWPVKLWSILVMDCLALLSVFGFWAWFIS